MENGLIERCVAGDQAAFQQLYQKYARRIRGICFGFMRNSEGEDLAQDVAMKAWEHVKGCKFESEGKFFAWLARIARNACINKLRTSKIRKEEELLETIACSDEGPSPFDQASFGEITDYLERGFGDLTLDHERILRLRLEGFSYREIAETEGIPIGTVMSRLYRARCELEVVLGGDPVEKIKSGDIESNGVHKTITNPTTRSSVPEPTPLGIQQEMATDLETERRSIKEMIEKVRHLGGVTGIESLELGEKMDKQLFEENASEVLKYYWFRPMGAHGGFTVAQIESSLGDKINHSASVLVTEMVDAGLLIKVGEDRFSAPIYNVKHGRKTEDLAIAGEFMQGLDKMDEIVGQLVVLLPRLRVTQIKRDDNIPPIGRPKLLALLRIQLSLTEEDVHGRVILDAFEKAVEECPGYFAPLNRGPDGSIHQYRIFREVSTPDAGATKSSPPPAPTPSLSPSASPSARDPSPAGLNPPDFSQFKRVPLWARAIALYEGLPGTTMEEKSEASLEAVLLCSGIEGGGLAAKFGRQLKDAGVAENKWVKGGSRTGLRFAGLTWLKDPRKVWAKKKPDVSVPKPTPPPPAPVSRPAPRPTCADVPPAPVPVTPKTKSAALEPSTTGTSVSDSVHTDLAQAMEALLRTFRSVPAGSTLSTTTKRALQATVDAQLLALGELKHELK
jgi:RNA polymerase sigma-70 factor (ECF subfamily)